MKNGKKLGALCCAIALAVTCAVPAFAYDNNNSGGYHKVMSSHINNNHGDWIYTVSAEDNSGGTPYYTELRPKEDKSWAYVRSDSSNQSNLFCWVIRSRSNGYSGDETDRYYGHDTYNGASQNQVRVAPGREEFLTNYVREDNFDEAGIGFIMQKEYVDYTFWWSPDSIR